MSQSSRRKTTEKQSEPNSSIKIKGYVKNNIGAAIGPGARADVRINTPEANVEKPTARARTGDLIIIRVAALVIGLAGVLLSVAVFIRLIGDFDPLILLLLVLIVVIAVLGVIGTLKPDSVYRLYKSIIEKK